MCEVWKLQPLLHEPGCSNSELCLGVTMEYLSQLSNCFPFVDFEDSQVFYDGVNLLMDTSSVRFNCL